MLFSALGDVNQPSCRETKKRQRPPLLPAGRPLPNLLVADMTSSLEHVIERSLEELPKSRMMREQIQAGIAD
jgi:hypothetical protein